MYDIAGQGPINSSGILHQRTRGRRATGPSQENSSRRFLQPKSKTCPDEPTRDGTPNRPPLRSHYLPRPVGAVSPTIRRPSMRQESEALHLYIHLVFRGIISTPELSLLRNSQAISKTKNRPLSVPYAWVRSAIILLPRIISHIQE
ncbi:hypothetical protein EVAR_103031_1 [Eumeta japonica]|uniref:Uncharacterized protein n=1 Tax=Eumeta variegata TaxID=151549 RepID=A0A4C1WBB4_EUMVA|nr:hypothetical protein EVAR_103031_1 [Eumeta japonica]